MGLRAADFWALSLPEWRALCEARFPKAVMPLGRADLETLVKAHPDV